MLVFDSTFYVVTFIEIYQILDNYRDQILDFICWNRPVTKEKKYKLLYKAEEHLLIGSSPELPIFHFMCKETYSAIYVSMHELLLVLYKYFS